MSVSQVNLGQSASLSFLPGVVLEGNHWDKWITGFSWASGCLSWHLITSAKELKEHKTLTPTSGLASLWPPN